MMVHNTSSCVNRNGSRGVAESFFGWSFFKFIVHQFFVVIFGCPWKYLVENYESTSNDAQSSGGCNVSKGILVKFSASYLSHSSRQAQRKYSSNPLVLFSVLKLFMY